MKPPKTITVFTHQFPDDTEEAVRRLIEVATSRGIQLRFPPGEGDKHDLTNCPDGLIDAPADGDADLAIVFGGDGTILSALRCFARRPVSVFAFNYGAIGFLSTVDHGEFEHGLDLPRRLAKLLRDHGWELTRIGGGATKQVWGFRRTVPQLDAPLAAPHLPPSDCRY